MQTKKKSKNIPQIITLILHLLMLVAVLFLMRYVRDLLYNDAQINMTEVITQNKEVITSKLQTELNRLAFISAALEDRMQRSGGANTAKAVFVDYARDYGESTLYVADKNGIACFMDGREVDISSREYFHLAMQGVCNISDRAISLVDARDVFTMSVPLFYHNEIIGTLQKQYSPQELYEICALSLFSSQGQMHIVNQSGKILMSSSGDDTHGPLDLNYLTMLNRNGNAQITRRIQEDFYAAKSGFVEVSLDNKPHFLTYTPINGIYDWFLLSSVETGVVTANASVVITMFYGILLTALILFGVSSAYFLYYKDKQQAALEKIAFVDSVTGGNTFTRFSVVLRETLRAYPQKQFYLMVLDIDNFKYVNNYYGFDYGDRILYKINQSIGKRLAPNESMARIYSDHFVLLVEDVSEERLNLITHPDIQDEDVPIYFSAGLYAIRDPKESINQMMDKATIASRSAKGTVHNQVVLYSEKFDSQLVKSEQMKRLVAEALQNDEMIPFFQPKVDVNTKELVGAEALARWKRSDGEMIQPFEFIPICEQTGQIVDVDMVIFEKTLRFLKRNLDKGVRCVPISVNFSRLHLADEQFLKVVVEKMKEYDIPAHLLEMELTESIIFGNHELIASFTAQLHALGLVISMDDFGSGYSSLNMLKDIPIDVLKIDQGFLRETTNSNRQRIIFSAIAQMAEQLKIRVVVEGVETLENVEMMKEYGCFVAQGYYYARPMAEEEFEKIYQKGHLV